MSELDAEVGSPLARLRAAAERQTDDLYLPVPGARWAGRLIARIVPVGPDGARANAERVVAEAAAGYHRDGSDVHADTIAMFTAGLYWDEGELRPIPGADGAPMRFGPALAEAIGEPDVTTARGAVFAAFTELVEDEPPVLNASALGAFANKVAAWTIDTSTEIAGRVTAPGS